MPFEVLGPHHRQARHSPVEIFARYMNDPARMNAALVHVITDMAGTANPQFRQMLDAMGFYTDITRKQAALQKKIQEYRLLGRNVSDKLLEQEQLNRELEMASLALMLAMMP